MMRSQITVCRWMLRLAVLFLVLASIACGGSQRSLIGKWQGGDADEVWEFSNEGTVSVSSGDLSAAGTYEFIAADHIRVEFRELMALNGPQVLQVAVAGDQLTLKSPSLGSLQLTRVK
jgi:hypothetical protein